jgi:hypothetical protein
VRERRYSSFPSITKRKGAGHSVAFSGDFGGWYQTPDPFERALRGPLGAPQRAGHAVGVRGAGSSVLARLDPRINTRFQEARMRSNALRSREWGIPTILRPKA